MRIYTHIYVYNHCITGDILYVCYVRGMFFTPPMLGPTQRFPYLGIRVVGED